MPLAGERIAARRNASASRVLVGVAGGRRHWSSLISFDSDLRQPGHPAGTPSILIREQN
jgi:hypothetical protein